MKNKMAIILLSSMFSLPCITKSFIANAEKVYYQIENFKDINSNH